MTEQSIGELITERYDDWMRIQGIEGVAIGDHKGAFCIRIFTVINPMDLHDKIPSDVKGYTVYMERTEPFGAPARKD